MSIKEALENKLRTELDHWDKEIQELEARAEKEDADAELQRESYQKIDALRQGMDDARQKLADLQEAGEDAAKDLQGKVNETIGNVRKALGG